MVDLGSAVLLAGVLFFLERRFVRNVEVVATRVATTTADSRIDEQSQRTAGKFEELSRWLAVRIGGLCKLQILVCSRGESAGKCRFNYERHRKVANLLPDSFIVCRTSVNDVWYRNSAAIRPNASRACHEHEFPPRSPQDLMRCAR